MKVNGRFEKAALCFLALLATQLPASFAQSEQSADQSAFQDDDELMRINNAQVRDMQGQEQNAEMQAANDDQRNSAYRLYAQKRVQDLEKLKNTPNVQQQISVLQRWLNADAQMRLRDQQTIASLRKRIAAMEQTQQQTMGNLGNDVAAMREAANDAQSDNKFRQQMQMNYFNEMQSEMGPASFNQASRGPSYSMGGMGFNGGQTLWGGGY
jgi:hypothetical protein